MLLLTDWDPLQKPGTLDSPNEMGSNVDTIIVISLVAFTRTAKRRLGVITPQVLTFND